MDFDLNRFRALAFGKEKLPDHPVSDETEARRMIEALPAHDPAASLAELTACVLSINQDGTFTPGRRARVLMELDIAAHVFWRPLGAAYLAPEGVPLDGRDGNSSLLTALQESAAEFAVGFGLCVGKKEFDADWIRDNRLAVMLRRARWVTRKMILSRMLNLPGAVARWTELNDMYRLAAENDLLRNVSTVFQGNTRTSSVKHEYLRMLLVDITSPDRMLGRDMELAYRLIGRIVSTVQLEPEPIEGALYFIVPVKAHHPVSLFRYSGAVPKGALYMHVANAVPRLKAMLERDAGIAAGDPDPMFGAVFTMRERRALLNHMLIQWSENPAQRAAKRISMKGKASLVHGVAGIVDVIRKHDQGGFNADKATASKLRIQFDNTVTIQKKNIREISGELVDASATGLGIALPRTEARWAKIGAIVGILTAPGAEWVLGVVRRINAKDDHLELGINVLTRKPRLLWCEINDSSESSVWDEEKRFERNFDEHYAKGILLGQQGDKLVAGEMLFPTGASKRGSWFDVPVKDGKTRLLITKVCEQTHDFQRVEFEPHPI
jgi:hypothetical protein